jgi:hypothetical protein
MNNYPSQLLIVLNLNYSIPPSLVIQSNQKISQKVAVERFFTTNQISPDWFSPGTLRINNLSKLQEKLDELKSKIEQKNRKYQRVELIAKNRYRIIFDNANPDMIIGTFKFDWVNRIYEIKMEIDHRYLESLNSSIQIEKTLQLSSRLFYI